MVAERIEYEVTAADDTAEAAESIDGRFRGMFKGLATAAAAVGGALIVGIEQAVADAQDSFRRLRISTGSADEETQQLLSDLLLSGVQEDEAIEGIVALQANFRNLGVNRTNRSTARTLADVASLGGDPIAATQALTQFGVTGSENIRTTLGLGQVAALGSPLGSAGLLQALATYGPVLNEFGLNFLESAALLVDLSQQGINVSRIGPAFNRFIRDASAEGISPRLLALEATDRLRAASDVDAAAIGQELFGAEGGLRLTSAIRSGRVGFGEELALDLSGATPQALTRLTDRQLYEAVVAGANLSDDLSQRIGGGLAGIADNLPLIGGAGAGLVGRAFRGIGYGQAYEGETVENRLLTAQAEYNELLRQQLDVNRAQLAVLQNARNIYSPSEEEFVEIRAGRGVEFR